MKIDSFKNVGSKDATVGTLRAREFNVNTALHYRSMEDGPAAAKLLDLLGFTRMSSPAGYPFCHYVVDSRRGYDGDGILYVMQQPEALRELNQAINDALKVGQPGEHPVVAK